MTSSFLKVKCKKCGEERIIFSHTTKKITCSCGETLAESSGGKAFILGEVVEELG